MIPASFCSISSSPGDEMGMLEDMCVGLGSLTCVKFKVSYFRTAMFYNNIVSSNDNGNGW